jgi:peptidyl-prolyl cis-trans isomerase C
MKNNLSKYILISLSIFSLSFSENHSADATKAKTDSSLPKDSAVVATVEGVKITFSEIKKIHAILPEQLKQIPFEKLYDILVQRVIELKLLEKKAEDSGISKEDAVKEKIAEMIKTIYKKELLNREVKKLVTQDLLRNKYKEVKEAILKDKNREKQINIMFAIFDKKSDADKLRSKNTPTPKAFITSASEKTKSTSGDESVTVTQSMLSKTFSESIVNRIFKQKASSKNVYSLPNKKFMLVYCVSQSSFVPVPSFQEAAPQIAKAMEGELTQTVIDGYRKGAKIEVYSLDGKKEETDDSGMPIRLKKEIEKAKAAS